MYKSIKEKQWESDDYFRKKQEKKLRETIRFSYEKVPYYHELFENMNISPDDIRSIEDLQKLPILKKESINENWQKFIPVNLKQIKYLNKATGGTTGSPLRYRITKFERTLQSAINFNSWSWSGYRLGDPVIILGGSSLIPKKKDKYWKFIHRIFRNFIYLSAFDMTDEKMLQYISIINKGKSKIGYGYPSAWILLSKFIIEREIPVTKMKAVYTTSEKLYPYMRETIKKAFLCEVFDQYGLNDGGISAYECPSHEGLHIIPFRSIMEVVDESGAQISEGEGQVLATSLYNYAMPFIRYETGDIATIYSKNKVCSCGRKYRMIKEIRGRAVDFLKTPEGKNVHGWFFLYIFWEYCTGIKEYQVVQKEIDVIEVKIVAEPNFDMIQLEKIREIVRQKSKAWKLKFDFVDRIERTKSNKFKFIENRLV